MADSFINFEDIVLKSLITNHKFCKKVLPYIKKEYFEDYNKKQLFNIILQYVVKYKKIPTYESIIVECQNKNNLDIKIYDIIEKIRSNESNNDIEWLLYETERWAKNRALYLAISQSIGFLDDSKKQNQDYGQIENIFKDALSVGFDSNIGHDYVNDYKSRYKFYHRVEEKLPFDLQMFNKITNGGITRKTLNLVMAGTGVGKTIFLCHMAANYISQGYNVLYITLEMREELIAERIDANLMDITIDELRKLSESSYCNKFSKLIKEFNKGNIIIREYPTSTANVNHFRGLLSELKFKKKFIPDVIIIDYVNICSSSRMKNNGGDSYGMVKMISEELRGLGVEYDVPIWSATQTNRSGINSSDLNITSISESIGTVFTCDLLFSLILTEELVESGQIMVKQLKNRYYDVDLNKKFILGFDKSKMKFYDIDNSNGFEEPDPSDDFLSGFGSPKFPAEKRPNRFSDFNF